MLLFNRNMIFRLRIAFKWMMRAFSGYLASNQLLALWDRILAYDSLEILSGRPVLFFSFVQLFNCISSCRGDICLTERQCIDSDK